jgi:hypothetical protein
MLDNLTPQEKLQARLEPLITLLDREQIVRDLSLLQSNRKKELIDALVHRQAESELSG